MNKKNIFIILILFNIHSVLGFEWDYDKNYQRNRLYLHVVTNYALNHKWKYEWEKNFLTGNSIKMNYGSVTTKELLSDVELIINEELANNWRFYNNFSWYSSRHRDYEEKTNYMGLEKSISDNFSLFLLFNPDYEKEYIDSKIGLTWTSSSKTEYLRLAFIQYDFVYEQKNGQSGKTLQKPYGIDWKLRLEKQNLTLYSEGELTNGFKRKFTDIERSPEINFHHRQINEQETKLYYKANSKILLEIGNSFYQYYEKKNFWNSSYNFSYKNIILTNSLRTNIQLAPKYALRYELHHVYQNAEADGYRNYNYSRHEIIFPDIFIDYIMNKNVIYLGYFGSIYSWENNDRIKVYDFSNNGYADKIILGWRHTFPQNTKLKLSISHSTTYGGFGGANIQYMMFF